MAEPDCLILIAPDCDQVPIPKGLEHIGGEVMRRRQWGGRIWGEGVGKRWFLMCAEMLLPEERSDRDLKELWEKARQLL